MDRRKRVLVSLVACCSAAIAPCSLAGQDTPKIVPWQEERRALVRDPYSEQEVKAVFFHRQWREDPAAKGAYLLCSGRYRVDPTTGVSTCVSGRPNLAAIELPPAEAMAQREGTDIAMRYIDAGRGGGLLVVSYRVPGPKPR